MKTKAKDIEILESGNLEEKNFKNSYFKEIFKMKKLNDSSYGVTLIALIVTIIVLLILAGVTINMFLRENGVLKNTGFAKEKYENIAELEQNELAKVEDYIENHRSITQNQYNSLLEKIQKLEDAKGISEEDLNSMFYPNKYMSLSFTGNTAIVPRKGWLYIKYNKTTSGHYYYAYLNSREILATSNPTINCTDSVYIPVKENDVISVTDATYFTLELRYYEKDNANSSE